MTVSKTKFRYRFLKILTGSDLSRRRIPYMVARSETKGPVLWLTACIHGDEVGGMVIIHEIFRILRKRGLQCGEIHAFPLMNPIGFETRSRMITVSKEDLNRSFPGNPSGSLAERIAHAIFTAIVGTSPDIIIDLHNDWIKSIPYVPVDIVSGSRHEEIMRKTAELARGTGFIVVDDDEDTSGTLTYSLMESGISAIPIELGESYIVNEENVRFGVQSVMNMLVIHDMIAHEHDTFRHYTLERSEGRKLTFSHKPFSSTSGIIRFLVRPGDLVCVDQPVARIYNSFGKLRETVTADMNGIVLGHSDSSVAYPGAPVFAFGVFSDT